MNMFKVGGLCLLGSFISVAICFVTDFILLFLLSMVLFGVSCICLLVGLIKMLIEKLGVGKPNYNDKDSEEFITKAKEVEECFNNKVSDNKRQQKINREKRNDLQNDLDEKTKAKKQYDIAIKNFINSNTYKVQLGLSIDMISNVLIHNSKTVKLEEITSVQVKCNSQVITQTNTAEERKARKGLGSTVGRAAVGVALVGPAGAVLGLTGSKKSKGKSSTTTTQKEVNSYKVIILTSNMSNPMISINCGSIEENALKVSNAINNACMNIGSVETETHENNIAKSDELEFAIKELKEKVKILDKENNELKNIINSLNKECKKAIKQLRKEMKQQD